MKRDEAMELLDAARDGVPFGRRKIAEALIATGDMKPRGGVKKGQDLGGIKTIADLKERCVVDDITGCWHWRGGHNRPGGQPCLWLAKLQRTTSIGSAICFLKTGKTPERGVKWVVTCETKGCANPAHRKPGTQRDAMLSPSVPKRTPLHNAKIARSKRANSKTCSLELAEEIRSSKESLEEVSARTGVSYDMCSKIRCGVHWRPIATGASVFSLGASA